MQGQLFGMIYLPEFSLVVLQMNEVGIYIAPLIKLDCRYRTAPVVIIIALKVKTKILNLLQ